MDQEKKRARERKRGKGIRKVKYRQRSNRSINHALRHGEREELEEEVPESRSQRATLVINGEGVGRKTKGWENTHNWVAGVKK